MKGLLVFHGLYNLYETYGSQGKHQEKLIAHNMPNQSVLPFSFLIKNTWAKTQWDCSSIAERFWMIHEEWSANTDHGSCGAQLHRKSKSRRRNTCKRNTHACEINWIVCENRDKRCVCSYVQRMWNGKSDEAAWVSVCFTGLLYGEYQLRCLVVPPFKHNRQK